MMAAGLPLAALDATTGWRASWRGQLQEWAQQDWDCIIVGGGITGAGILLEAARRGWKVLLLEQRDFAWGTSSRSSKLVHGGLRYLKQGKFGLTAESVRERQSLLQQAAGLVEPQGFVLADMEGRKPGRWLYSIGLTVYDMMAGKASSRYLKAADLLMLAPNIAKDGLKGGLCYLDAKTDDARLVLRVLQEAQKHGAQAANYMAVEQVLRHDGKVCGVQVRDAINGNTLQFKAQMVISATGAWADKLRPQGAARIAQKIRPLRGSHLLFPAWRFPISQAISLMHPQDGRPVFAYPWEGATLVGTTDVDHDADLANEASITSAEVEYLMAALDAQFPDLKLSTKDILATYAGVRPVIDTGQVDPSKEGRDHVVWQEDGLLTVTGGKLTTFRPIALDALKHAARYLPHLPKAGPQTAIFAVDDFATPDATPDAPAANPTTLAALAAQLPSAVLLRLQGRYGQALSGLLAAAQPSELETIPGTQTQWAELRWAARSEACCHLEDLMLRRTRLGLLLEQGGRAHLPRIRAICQPELGWDDDAWEQEQQSYLALWQKHYGLPSALQPHGLKG
jgi:glycerol-3-phosphate dehydrogenase